MAFAFMMLDFVFKFNIMQKNASYQEVEKSDFSETVGFFQLSLVCLYLVKNKIIPHLGECRHLSLIFKTKLKTHVIFLKGYVF